LATLSAHVTTKDPLVNRARVAGGEEVGDRGALEVRKEDDEVAGRGGAQRTLEAGELARRALDARGLEARPLQLVLDDRRHGAGRAAAEVALEIVHEDARGPRERVWELEFLTELFPALGRVTEVQHDTVSYHLDYSAGTRWDLMEEALLATTRRELNRLIGKYAPDAPS